MENTVELNLRELFALIIHRLWMIVLSAVLAAAVAFVYTEKFVTPLYQTSIKVYVNNTTYSDKEGISNADLTTSQKLVYTYTEVIKSDSFLEKVSQAIEHKASALAIRNAMTMKSSSGTEMFTVTISNPDPELAAEIANTIADLVPVEVPKIAEGSSARIVDYAKVPTVPYSPSYTKNVMLGACIGAMLVVIILVIQVLLDLHIKGEDDLRKISDAPVLGYIPHYDADGKTTGYEYESASKDDSSDSEVMEV